MERDKQSNAAELSRREANQNKRALAGAKTEEYRKLLQIETSAVWLKLIAAHRSEYNGLRALAATTHNKQTPCTICNGRGSMDSCFLCGSSGKCPTCKGTGKLHFSERELCPTCRGTGECYLCTGTGKMICPFCEDGDVNLHSPLPSTRLPIK
jgi:DnaJ-class molecular chaperone